MNRRMLILLALLAGVAVFIVLDAGRDAAPAVVEPPVRKVRADSAPVDAQADSLQIASQPAALGEVRDIFGQAAPPAPESTATEAAPPPPPPPPPPLVLLGFREEGAVREAYLVQDGAVILVRPGGEVAGRYQILALGQDDVSIRDRESGQEHRITFGASQ